MITGSLSYASLGLILISVIAAAGGQLMLKRGMQLATASSHASGRSLVLTAVTTPWIPLGLCVFGLSAMVWLAALSRVPLSLAYPFNALGYLLILGTSVLFLHERVSPLTWAGTVLVVAGLIIVVVSQPLSRRPFIKGLIHFVIHRTDISPRRERERRQGRFAGQRQPRGGVFAGPWISRQ